MASLILIGVILFTSVFVIDLIVRGAIVCNMRKQKRAVKPLDVIIIEQTARGARANNRNAIVAQESIVDINEDIEIQSISSV